MALLSLARPVWAAGSSTSNGNTRATLDVSGTTVTTDDARLAALLLTTTTGRVFCTSAPMVGSSAAK